MAKTTKKAAAPAKTAKIPKAASKKAAAPGAAKVAPVRTGTRTAARIVVPPAQDPAKMEPAKVDKTMAIDGTGVEQKKQK